MSRRIFCRKRRRSKRNSPKSGIPRRPRRLPLLHQGLIRIIIFRIGQEAGISATYWQGGVCVYEKTARSHALIEQEMDNDIAGRICIKTQRGQAAALLDKISALVEEEQTKLGLTPREVSQRGSRKREALRAAKRDEASAKEERHAEFGASPSTQPRYYVSYAWSDEGEDREAIVDKLCDEAEKRGTPVLRDKKVLGFGDSIAKFTKDIGRGDRVFIILSDKYLKSPFCMIELFEIWRF
jgi:internalin A